jgi:hypothetical protein
MNGPITTAYHSAAPLSMAITHRARCCVSIRSATPAERHQARAEGQRGCVGQAQAECEDARGLDAQTAACDRILQTLLRLTGLAPRPPSTQAPLGGGWGRIWDECGMMGGGG